MSRAARLILLVAVSVLWMPCGACAQTNHDEPPINYQSTKARDRVARLIERLEANETVIEWDEGHGWLPDLLARLEVPRSSQTLVFSKTSQQHRKISPSNPRAIYFSDDVYLGFVPSGDFIEIASVDPVQGAMFYTLDLKRSKQAVIRRASSSCLSCHKNHKTQGVPGFLVRSVFPKRSGHPEYRFGTTPTDHRTPFSDRFGGWYVTGQHGDMRHRGNVVVQKDANDDKDALDREAGANLNSLPVHSNVSRHLEPTSDLVALMILEHQTQFHNFVTQASYETRIALHQQAEMNRLLERDSGFRSESTKRRIRSVAEELVEYLLFCDEYALLSPVSGNLKFMDDFSSKAIKDSRGRSLRDLDLSTRLLKYPCSYLIYSESFRSLPEPVLKIVMQRLREVLSGEDESEEFRHLSAADRAAIFEILAETHTLFGNE